MINANEYLFYEAYILDCVDAVTAAPIDVLKMQVNIVHNVNGKVTVIPHIPTKLGHSRGPFTLLYIHKSTIAT